MNHKSNTLYKKTLVLGRFDLKLLSFFSEFRFDAEKKPTHAHSHKHTNTHTHKHTHEDTLWSR